MIALLVGTPSSAQPSGNLKGDRLSSYQAASLTKITIFGAEAGGIDDLYCRTAAGRGARGGWGGAAQAPRPRRAGLGPADVGWECGAMSFAPMPATAAWHHRGARSGFEVVYFDAHSEGCR